MDTPTVSRARRLLLSLLAGMLMLLSPGGLTAATAADYYWVYVIEGTWYKSPLTCQSRAISLIQTGEYRGPYNCRQDSLSGPNDRWTLRLYKKVYGGGGGGGGGGGWSSPV